MIRYTISLALALALTGCGGFQKGAEDAVRKSLKDPDSAQFGNFYFNKKTQKGCLTVNAKNSMGGYTGDQQAYVRHTDAGWTEQGIADIPLDSCKEIYADEAY